MDERLAGVIGARVRATRVAQHQTRVVVAGLSGITTDYLYQIECGKKLPAIPVVIQLARTLGVPVSRLLEGPEAAASERPGMIDAGMVLHRALTQPVAPDEPPPVAELGERVRSAWRIWQTSPYRYSELARQLPVLITDTELVKQRYQRDGERPERRRAQRCAADLYGLLRTVTKRVGRADLSLLAADRAIRAAEAADDPHRMAAAQGNLAHVQLADHEAEGAEAVALRAAETLAALAHAGDGDATALCGALRLLGALASVRQGQVGRLGSACGLWWHWRSEPVNVTPAGRRSDRRTSPCTR